jgi:hypothetical protein
MRGRLDGSSPGWFGRRARGVDCASGYTPRALLAQPLRLGEEMPGLVDADLTVEDVFRR